MFYQKLRGWHPYWTAPWLINVFILLSEENTPIKPPLQSFDFMKRKQPLADYTIFPNKCQANNETFLKFFEVFYNCSPSLHENLQGRPWSDGLIYNDSRFFYFTYNGIVGKFFKNFWVIFYRPYPMRSLYNTAHGLSCNTRIIRAGCWRADRHTFHRTTRFQVGDQGRLV